MKDGIGTGMGERKRPMEKKGGRSIMHHDTYRCRRYLIVKSLHDEKSKKKGKDRGPLMLSLDTTLKNSG